MDAGWFLVFLLCIGSALGQSDSYHVRRQVVEPDADLVAAGYSLSAELYCGITVHWKPLLEDGTVSMALRTTTDGYVSVAYPGDTYGMVGDAIIGWVSGGTADVQSYYLKGKSSSAVVANSELTISNVSGTEVDGVTTIYFSRLLNAGFNPITDITQVNMTVASGGTDKLALHSCRSNSLSTVNLETGEVSTAPPPTPPTPTPTPPPTDGGDDDGQVIGEDLIAAGYSFFQTLGCRVAVYWMPIEEGTEEVKFAVRGALDGWVGIGFPSDSVLKMVGSDSVIGWVDGSDTSIDSYYLEGKSTDKIIANSLMEITDHSATLEDGVTTLYFTRTLSSGYNPIINPASVPVITAVLEGEHHLAYHSCSSDLFLLNLLSGSGAEGYSGDERKDAHGALMIIGWGTFLIVGVMIARYGKDVLTEGGWFRVHQILQGIGLFLTTIGLIIAFVMVDGAHFTTDFHGQLGLTVMILAYLQTLGGIFRPHVPQEGQEKTTLRKAFEIAHPWGGRITLLLSIITIFAGISIWWHWWVFILYGCFLGLLVILVVAGEVYLFKEGSGLAKTKEIDRV
eukprot:TRINITY_DN3410_c0_g1_i1.p1 TRINITY_DN3410_c0_g1~~TRINITY_DN3410_c0_g1_i1.p1  ORF type:complete len:575 (+),score=109.78 TRINITY_DN3410_c0_g1_i1:31-1725(+)